MALGNIKSVEMAEFFTMLHAQKPVKQATVDTGRIDALYRELESLREYLDSDDISYMDAIEARNDINACRQEIERLERQAIVVTEPKYMSDAIVGYKQTLSDNAKIKAEQKMARLCNSRDRIKSEFEKTHVIGMTDEDIDKCDRLLMQHNQIKNAIIAATNQKAK